MKKGLIVTACLLFLSAACSPDGEADKLTGRVCVMDGDTLMIGGTRRHTKCAEGQIVDLWGITAFGLDQLCPHPSGRLVRCGLFAAAQLQEKVKTSEVRCEEKASKFGGVISAQCFVGDDDIGQYMVANGFAKADALVTERYTGHEAQAKAQRRGLWETGAK
ncbi:MAG: thermonuclease family protein [Rhodospirillales bacterium]